jgi:hypothetical protein
VRGADFVGHGMHVAFGHASVEDGLPQEGGHFTTLPATRVPVLTNDDLVEDRARQQPEGARVLVSAIAGNSHDSNAAPRRRALDEVGDRLQGSDVVRVVHDHLSSSNVEEIEAPRRLPEVGGECA